MHITARFHFTMQASVKGLPDKSLANMLRRMDGTTATSQHVPKDVDPASGAQAQQEDPNIAAAKELDFLGKECVYIYIYKHIQKSVDKYSYMYNGKLFEISEHTPENTQWFSNIFTS